MSSGWNVLLQLEQATAGNSKCLRFTVAGTVVPAHICIHSAQASDDALATRLFAELEQRIRVLAGAPTSCSGPRGPGCQAWKEPSCTHVLGIVIGSLPGHPSLDNLAAKWQAQHPGQATVVPVLANGLTTDKVFAGNALPTLSQCNALTAGTSMATVADKVMALALLDERPGVFVSYLRKEASGAADSLFDGLSRVGFGVFLDRFSGTPGRQFPQELAEAMSGMGIVLLLETASLFKSNWTLWEAAFARRYRLGPLAVNFNNVRPLRGALDRRPSTANPMARLPPPEVDAVVGFVRMYAAPIAIHRRAYYETIVDVAARTRGRTMGRLAGGGLEILDGGKPKGRVVVSGAPAQVRHLRRLHEVAGGLPAILAGEHRHLPPSSYAALKYVATNLSLEPTGAASLYPRVRQL
nr:hypothetical protein Hi04_10k_c5380_00020 [uncultured bacterium]